MKTLKIRLYSPPQQISGTSKPPDDHRKKDEIDAAPLRTDGVLPWMKAKM